MPHAVFSTQILPKDVQSSPQPGNEKIPSSRPESKRLISHLRAAARSAVREWHKRGVEPSQRMMFDMDVHKEETRELLASHLLASEESARQLVQRGLSIPSASSHDHAERLCYHAIRTTKGLAASPLNLQRVLARAGVEGAFDARDFTKFAIGLRAIADQSRDVREFLSKSSDEVTAEDMKPIVALVQNYAALDAGRVRKDSEGRLLSEVRREHVAAFGPDAYDRVSEALRSIETSANEQREGDLVSLLPLSNHASLLALPAVVASDLAAHDLDYAKWSKSGWQGTRTDMVLLEPKLVRMRIDGISDEIILALRPEIAGNSADYHYSPQTFLSGSGYYAVGGCSSRAGDRFGTEQYTHEAESIKAMHGERNAGKSPEWTSTH
jgi:hypothetical protein